MRKGTAPKKKNGALHSDFDFSFDSCLAFWSDALSRIQPISDRPFSLDSVVFFLGVFSVAHSSFRCDHRFLWSDLVILATAFNFIVVVGVGFLPISVGVLKFCFKHQNALVRFSAWPPPQSGPSRTLKKGGRAFDRLRALLLSVAAVFFFL